MEILRRSNRNSYDVVVIGGGPAGATAALRACELDARVALVERGLLGGVCTNDGCVPTRVLAKAARLRRDALQFDQYGLSGDPPEVDYARLMQQTLGRVFKMHEKKQLLDHLSRAGADVFAQAGNVAFADPHTLELANGDRLEGNKFIICAGGHARKLDFPGSELALTHADIWALDRMPTAVAVLGAAGTGCQVASILNSFGAEVWLLNRAPLILPTEEPEVGAAVSASFQAHGMHVVTGMGIQRIARRDGRLCVSYTQRDQEHSFTADAVVMAVGWEGNVQGLNLDAARVEVRHGYIAVNDFQQTSAPHIFAAGDITGRMMLVQSASYEGRLAAENAVLGPGQPYKHLIVPHGGFTDPEYASVGLTEAQAQADQECVSAVVSYAEVDRAVIDDRVDGFIKLIVSAETHRILGAHIVGEQALEAIQLVAAGMAADMWVEQLAELELAYPTFTSIVGLAARQICLKLGVVPMASRWREFGRAPVAEWEWADA